MQILSSVSLVLLYSFICTLCLSPMKLLVRIHKWRGAQIQHNVKKLVSDLRQVVGVCGYSVSSINKTAEILLKVPFSTMLSQGLPRPSDIFKVHIAMNPLFAIGCSFYFQVDLLIGTASSIFISI